MGKGERGVGNFEEERSNPPESVLCGDDAIECDEEKREEEESGRRRRIETYGEEEEEEELREKGDGMERRACLEREVGGIGEERIAVFEIDSRKVVEKGVLNHIESIEKGCEKSDSDEGEKREGCEEERVLRDEFGTPVPIAVEEEGECEDDWEESEVDSESVEEGSEDSVPFV